MKNGFVDSCKCRMREELLNKTMFHNMAHARIAISDWAAGENTERPHSDSDYTTLTKYARTLTVAIVDPPLREMKAPRGGNGSTCAN